MLKKMSNLMVIAGILLAIYSIFGRFYGAPTIGFGVIHLKAISGITAAILLIVLGLAAKFWQE